ncbi:glia-derived nexin-like, partial [Hyposmocoma kahamanoa]|uniref:glia-derived nexin-like n=1 Tax=Hyposmocoma kahamanoa TaxID=1477025 RepID=UPI000E6D9DED
MILKMKRNFPFLIAFIWLQNMSSMYGQKLTNSRLNYFDTDLLRYFGEEKEGNVMISPASVKSILAMILEGAGGSTATEIRSALRLSLNKEEYREQLNLYLCALQANTTGTLLKNANGVFMSDKMRLNKDYEIMLRKVYFAEVNRMNFKDPIPVAEKINSWVNTSTKGLIPAIVEPDLLDKWEATIDFKNKCFNTKNASNDIKVYDSQNTNLYEDIIPAGSSKLVRVPINIHDGDAIINEQSISNCVIAECLTT